MVTGPVIGAMVRKALLGLAVSCALTASPAAAAVIFASPDGAVQHPFPLLGGDGFGSGPVALDSEATWQSYYDYSVFGYTGDYNFVTNGHWSGTPMAGLNTGYGFMTLTFTSQMSAFGADINWIPFYDTEIRAYDNQGALIETLQLTNEDGNVLTPGYIGLATATPFRKLVFSGGYVAFRNLETVTTGIPAAVPEPATWLIMIGGLGLTGAALRRRRARTDIAAFA